MVNAIVEASVRKAAVLTLCIASCFCLISGCVNSTSNQNASGQGANLQASQLSVGSAVTALDQPVSIQATLKDGNGRPLDGKAVEWFIDGASVGRSQVNSGVTAMNLTPEFVDNLGIQTHQVRVSFYGDASYESSTASSLLQITATGTPEGITAPNSTITAA
ncbi:MAG TPA: Ig-like domain-containing protein [Candidatus Bathyarchaeia archaeon]|nr:Ig-like domain-containing protein [Candidatus Bathyarchaeia archaeon]